MSEEEAIHYIRDQPIWWLQQEAVFVVYRKKRVVIDTLQPINGKHRRMVDLTDIRPREETQHGREETPTQDPDEEAGNRAKGMD